MPLHTSTASPRRAGLARAAIIVAASCIAGGAGTVAVSDGRASAADRSISRYHDIEANKAKSMRALGLATMQASHPSPYGDIEANKAGNMRAR